MGKGSKEGFGHESEKKERNFDLGSKEEKNKAQTLTSYEKGREERGLIWLHDPSKKERRRSSYLRAPPPAVHDAARDERIGP